MEKAELAAARRRHDQLLHQGGIITTTIALQELKQSSIMTGRFTNITEEDIEDSKQAPPPWEQPDPNDPNAMMGGGMPGQPGGAPGQPGGAPGQPGAGGQPKLPGAAAPSLAPAAGPFGKPGGGGGDSVPRQPNYWRRERAA